MWVREEYRKCTLLHIYYIQSTVNANISYDS